jgi:cell division septal protein FtsQ
MNDLLSNRVSSGNRFWLKLSLVITLVLSFTFGFFFQKFWQIKEIKAPSELKKSLLKPLYQENLLWLDTSVWKEKILQSDPWIKAVFFQKHYPEKLIIKIEREQPLAQLIDKENILLVSQTGKILAKRTQLNKKLVQIMLYQQLRGYESKINTKINNSDLLYVLKLIQQSDQLPFDISNVKITQPSRIEIQATENSPLIILNRKKSIAKNIYIVQNIIKSLSKTGEKPKVINLLFEKPVIIL